MRTVYLIQNTVTGEQYVGKTDNLKRRIMEHNSGNNHSTRRTNGYWILIYAEAYRDKKDADEREAKLKQRGSAKQKLIKRLKTSLLKIKK